MTLTDLETAVASWLNAVRGPRELVKGRIGEAAAPAVPYVMYSIDAVGELSALFEVEDDGTIQRTQASDTSVTVVMSVVGDLPGAPARNDALRILLTLGHSQRTADLLGKAGFLGLNGPRNMSAVEVGAMRQRWDCSVELSAILTAEAPSETIGGLEVGIYEHTIPTQIILDITEP